MSQEQRSGSWRTEPGETSVGSVPSEVARPEPRRDVIPTAVRPGAYRDTVDGTPPPARVVPASPVRKRPGLRRVKRVLRHVEPLSVLRIALFYSAIFLVVWLGVVAVVFWLVDSRGLFDSLEELSDGLALGWNIDITMFWVQKWAFLIGLTVAMLGSLFSVFLAIVYNIAADLFGGVEMTHVERDL